jgi:hypothetical protein
VQGLKLLYAEFILNVEVKPGVKFSEEGTRV